ncbi:hypothetical protein [Noviherbaspirillum pedocola]|uniref:Uncharacterized protein n=1 Tax=Noviherbaspirillum pedocola TaxID=2801341 RepID=A0A934T465_9BURK|nr:hypothetical protein [Noviherbaspirillum pedocola]MBK4738743.1 hypothetical protein [Noviherbaspirillum pedocola]
MVELSEQTRLAEKVTAELVARVALPLPEPISCIDVLADMVAGSATVHLTSDFAKTLLDDLLRAQRIADDAARSTVELECQMCDVDGLPAGAKTPSDGPWYDTRKVACRFSMPLLIDALIYLDKRGILHRDACQRYLVTFRKSGPRA